MMRTKVTVHCDGPTCGRNIAVPPRHVSGAHHLVEAIPGWIAIAVKDIAEWWDDDHPAVMHTFCSSACLEAYQAELTDTIRQDTAEAEAAVAAKYASRA